jgi:ATP-dependent phosphofructokinase / diphosphate-dependent phosphofructokinase
MSMSSPFAAVPRPKNRCVVDVPLAMAIERPQQVDPDSALVRTTRGLGISLGDA